MTPHDDAPTEPTRCHFCGDESDSVRAKVLPNGSEVGVCQDRICKEALRAIRDANAPPGSDRAPAGMNRATGIDDPTPRAEYGDR